MKLETDCKHILDQLAGIMRQLEEEDYCAPSVTLSRGTIGQHIRHTLEFFVCLKQGTASGVVNYDNREHDLLIESDKNRALDLAAEIMEFVSRPMDHQDLLLEVGDAEDSGLTLPTNYARELVYNLEHAVHHMALVKIGLREVAPYVQIPLDFGIANSTLRYRESLQAAR
ncbi:MAG: hypothetical protein SH819_05505 [Cytophagales bacterium]|nr:hypothetical protein [Cytophagales bacterium]